MSDIPFEDNFDRADSDSHANWTAWNPWAWIWGGCTVLLLIVIAILTINKTH